MATLLSFQKVSLFKDKPFGITGVSFEIERNRRYYLHTDLPERLNTIAGLVEGRYSKETGYIERKEKLFLQSDRLLLGEKIYEKKVGQWLALGSEFFNFGNRQRSKFGMIQSLNAAYLMDRPIYKLKGEDRIKFTLLALAFQESGIILISSLLTQDLDTSYKEFLLRIIRESHTTPCLLEACPGWIEDYKSEIPELIKINLGTNNKGI
jgi:hypothetical protein